MANIAEYTGKTGRSVAPFRARLDQPSSKSGNLDTRPNLKWHQDLIKLVSDSAGLLQLIDTDRPEWLSSVQNGHFEITHAAARSSSNQVSASIDVHGLEIDVWSGTSSPARSIENAAVVVRFEDRGSQQGAGTYLSAERVKQFLSVPADKLDGTRSMDQVLTGIGRCNTIDSQFWAKARGTSHDDYVDAILSNLYLRQPHEQAIGEQLMALAEKHGKECQPGWQARLEDLMRFLPLRYPEWRGIKQIVADPPYLYLALRKAGFAPEKAIDVIANQAFLSLPGDEHGVKASAAKVGVAIQYGLMEGLQPEALASRPTVRRVANGGEDLCNAPGIAEEAWGPVRARLKALALESKAHHAALTVQPSNQTRYL